MKQPAILKAKQSSRCMALGLISIFIALFNFNNLFGATRTASVSGNWHNTTTWGGEAVPLSTDDVIINTGVTVTMDDDAACKSVTTGTATGTAAIAGYKALSTGKLTISNGGGTSQTQIIFSIGSGTNLVCTSIKTIVGNGNGTVKLIVSGTLRNSGTTDILHAFTCNTGSTVEYCGGEQTIFRTMYSNLVLSGSGIKWMTSITNINGNLSIIGTIISTISSDFSVGGNLEIGVGTALTINTATISGTTSISGKLTLANTATKTFNGNVTINTGGTWSETDVGAINYSGNLQNDGVYTASGGYHTFSGNEKTISGNISIPMLTINGKTTNVNTLTVSSRLAGASILSNNGILNVGGSSINPTLIATAKDNIVNYNGTSQTIKATTYNNLTVSGSYTKTLSGNSTINGDLTVISGTLDLSTCTANRSNSGGTLSVANNATLKIGGTNTFPANYLTHLIGATSTIEYSGTNQLISGETYGNLTTSGTGTKTIIANSTVTVEGNLTIGSLLTINSNANNSGSLIVKGTSSGDVIYNRWYNSAASPASYSRWYITASPVNVTAGFGSNASKIHQDANNGNKYDFATYTEAGNAGWQYQDAIPQGLTPGQGYLISLKSATDGMIQFTGKLNNGIVTPAVSSSTNNGWNAVGNPYTSAIGITSSALSNENFLTLNSNQLNSSFAAIYVWNETSSYDETQQYYKVIGNSGYIPDGSPGGTLSDINIQSGQGFLINSKVNGSVTFTKGMQVHQTDLSLKSAEISWPGITLLAESHGQSRSTVVAFNDKMTTGLDVTYDAGLLFSNNFKVFTHLVDGNNPVDFAIQCLPDHQYSQLSVPVGVDLAEGGNLVFKVSGNLLPNGLYPVIEDKELHIKTTLKTETDSYTVTFAKNTTGIGRFYLSFSSDASGNPEVPMTNRFTASCVNSHIVLYGAVEPGTKALVYDISGRKMGEYPLKNLNRNEITVSSLSQRVYLLKIESKNYSKVLKLVPINY